MKSENLDGQIHFADISMCQVSTTERARSNCVQHQLDSSYDDRFMQTRGCSVIAMLLPAVALSIKVTKGKEKTLTEMYR
jgi:hypothetical protein